MGAGQEAAALALRRVWEASRRVKPGLLVLNTSRWVLVAGSLRSSWACAHGGGREGCGGAQWMSAELGGLVQDIWSADGRAVGAGVVQLNAGMQLVRFAVSLVFASCARLWEGELWDARVALGHWGAAGEGSQRCGRWSWVLGVGNGGGHWMCSWSCDWAASRIVMCVETAN